jgi:hypothetical protein
MTESGAQRDPFRRPASGVDKPANGVRDARNSRVRKGRSRLRPGQSGAGHSRLQALLAVIVSAGCATTPVRSDPLAARFHSEAALQARATAPDLYARAQHALSDRAQASNAEARLQHAERAALLLDAAIAETRRLSAARAAASAEAHWARAVDQRAQLEQQRQALEAQLERDRAGRLTDARVQRARAPGVNPGNALPTRQAAEVLHERALLVLAAATAFGLDPERGAALELTIARAAQTPDAGARLGATRAALREAERALREARAGIVEAPKSVPNLRPIRGPG